LNQREARKKEEIEDPKEVNNIVIFLSRGDRRKKVRSGFRVTKRRVRLKKKAKRLGPIYYSINLTNWVHRLMEKRKVWKLGEREAKEQDLGCVNEEVKKY